MRIVRLQVDPAIGNGNCKNEPAYHVILTGALKTLNDSVLTAREKSLLKKGSKIGKNRLGKLTLKENMQVVLLQ